MTFAEHSDILLMIIGATLTILLSIIAWVGKEMWKKQKEQDQRMTEIEHNYLDRFDQVNKGITEILVGIEKLDGKITKQAEVCSLIQEQKKIQK